MTSAILNAVVAEDLPGPGSVFLEVHWRFKAPVRPGDSITGRVEVTEVRDGFECGINLGSYNDLQLGDLIATYEMREKPRA